MIGARPRTDWLPAEIARDARGFILTGADLGERPAWPLERSPFLLETSMPGVFAAGDVRHGVGQAGGLRGRRGLDRDPAGAPAGGRGRLHTEPGIPLRSYALDQDHGLG